MFAGPIFSREALTQPRQLRHFLVRSTYVGLLLVLLWTIGQTTFGFQDVQGIAAMASFGNLSFQILGFVQITLVLFFSLLFTAGNIAQEKDRQTLILLLMTDLSNREIVLGKLLASLLQIGTLIISSLPVFLFLLLLGGIETSQVLWFFLLSLVTAALAGSWAAMIAFWREKTFQTLATSVLGMVVYLGVFETLAAVFPPASLAAEWAAVFSPYRAMAVLMAPLASEAIGPAQVSVLNSIIAMALLAVFFCGVSINRLRIWNPSRTLFVQPELTEETSEAGEKRRVVRHRRIWSSPVIWREIMTRAYGRRTLAVKIAYLAMAGVIFYQAFYEVGEVELVLGMLSRPVFAFLGLSILGLMLVNAQAVTAITGERDGRTLDLLIATDITAREFVYGKLGGVLFNTKELALVPLLFVAWFVIQGVTSAEDAVYLTVGYLSLVAFAAMLGLHSGMGYASSRQAILNSMGTIFFLFVGIFILLVLLVETRGAFANQITAFFLFICFGGVALVYSLTHRNPSPALMLSGGMLPMLTFYAITTYLLGGTLGVSFAIALAYGFTTTAMLIPAVSEFDVALGRSTTDKG